MMPNPNPDFTAIKPLEQSVDDIEAAERKAVLAPMSIGSGRIAVAQDLGGADFALAEGRTDG